MVVREVVKKVVTGGSGNKGSDNDFFFSFVPFPNFPSYFFFNAIFSTQISSLHFSSGVLSIRIINHLFLCVCFAVILTLLFLYAFDASTVIVSILLRALRSKAEHSMKQYSRTSHETV